MWWASEKGERSKQRPCEEKGKFKNRTLENRKSAAPGGTRPKTDCARGSQNL